jgi:hypothetical protein
MFKIYGMVFEIICIVIWSMVSSINNRKHPKRLKKLKKNGIS